MFTLFMFLALIYFSINIYSQDVEVVNSGLRKLKENDMTVVFYVTLRNNGLTTRKVLFTAAECCEIITDGETDCDTIELHGNDQSVLDGNMVKNLTFLYPNLYGYNRKGWCLLSLWQRTFGKRDGNEIRYRINFDTTLRADVVHPVVENIYNPAMVNKCDTPDLDPFDNCNPVNCILKYSGFRNFYNRKWKRCQKVPICNADPAKDLADVVYIATSNVCSNAEGLSEDDVIDIIQEKSDVTDVEDQMIKIRCHNGYIDSKTGLCICDPGWRSEPFDPDVYNPDTVYLMCNIKCHADEKRKNDTHWQYVIGIVIALCLASFVLSFEVLGCFCRLMKKFKANAASCKLYCTIIEESDQNTCSCKRLANDEKSKSSTSGAFPEAEEQVLDVVSNISFNSKCSQENR